MVASCPALQPGMRLQSNTDVWEASDSPSLTQGWRPASRQLNVLNFQVGCVTAAVTDWSWRRPGKVTRFVFYRSFFSSLCMGVKMAMISGVPQCCCWLLQPAACTEGAFDATLERVAPSCIVHAWMETTSCHILHCENDLQVQIVHHAALCEGGHPNPHLAKTSPLSSPEFRRSKQDR